MIESTQDVCCVCGNLLTLYTKNECKLDTPWGKFVLHYHKACETPESKKLIVKKIKDVALAHEGIPMQNTLFSNNFDRLRREGKELTEGVPNTRYSADINTFELLGLEVVAGRVFHENDIKWVNSIALEGGPSIIISEVMAEALFSDEDPLGQLVVNGSGKQLTVIGIVKRAQAVSHPSAPEPQSE